MGWEGGGGEGNFCLFQIKMHMQNAESKAAVMRTRPSTEHQKKSHLFFIWSSIFGVFWHPVQNCPPTLVIRNFQPQSSTLPSFSTIAVVFHKCQFAKSHHKEKSLSRSRGRQVDGTEHRHPEPCHPECKSGQDSGHSTSFVPTNRGGSGKRFFGVEFEVKIF